MVERESKTQSKAINLLRKKGCYVYKNAQNMYTERGRPDLTACVPVTLETLNKLYQPKDTIGLFVGIEMKRPKRIKYIIGDIRIIKLPCSIQYFF